MVNDKANLTVGPIGGLGGQGIRTPAVTMLPPITLRIPYSVSSPLNSSVPKSVPPTLYPSLAAAATVSL